MLIDAVYRRQEGWAHVGDKRGSRWCSGGHRSGLIMEGGQAGRAAGLLAMQGMKIEAPHGRQPSCAQREFKPCCLCQVATMESQTCPQTPLAGHVHAPELLARLSPRHAPILPNLQTF